jgi:hypothetical protein
MYPINEDTISFTTTAMPRPEIIEKTYSSFCSRLGGLDYKRVRLYLNVDPLPDDQANERRAQVIEVGRRFFGQVVANIPEKPNFANAVKWAFSQPTTHYVFHLEDDWELMLPLKIQSFAQFFNNEHVQQVALRAWKIQGGNFFLSPSIIRSSFSRLIAEKMNENTNPEVQIRTLRDPQRHLFFYFPFDKHNVILRDLGRHWLSDAMYVRGGKDFVQWTKRLPTDPTPRVVDQNEQVPKAYNLPQGKDKHIIQWERNRRSIKRRRK